MRDMFGNKVEVGDLGYWVAGMGSPTFYIARVVKHQKRTQVVVLEGTYHDTTSWIETNKRFILISEEVTKLLLAKHYLDS